MFGTSLTALIIAALAGVGAYFAWSENRAVSIGLGVVCVVASAVAVLMAFLGTLALVFKLLPLVVLVIGVWFVWRAIDSEEKHPS